MSFITPMFPKKIVATNSVVSSSENTSNGLTGPTGQTGTAGSIGPTGLPGSFEAIGPTGPTGISGLTGPLEQLDPDLLVPQEQLDLDPLDLPGQVFGNKR